MANSYSKYSSVRVYRRYCFGAIFSGLLSLCVAAVFVGFYLLNAFDFVVEGGERISITGLQFVLYSLRATPLKLPQFYVDQLKPMTDYITAYSGSNQLLGTIKTIHPYIEYVLAALILISTIFALITGILGLVWILAGRLRDPKATSSLTTTSLIFFLIALSLTALYFFFVSEIIKDVVAGGAANAVFGCTSIVPLPIPIPVIFAAALLVLAIALGITYSAAFKNKVFAGLKKKNDSGAQVQNYADNGQPMPYQQMYNQCPAGMMNEPAPMRPAGKVGPATLPVDLKVIGDHAYSKCLSLKDATIPQGITDIGPSAFSNCLNLETVVIPITIKEIGYNAFFNTPNLKKIIYKGRVQDWKRIVKGSNWLTHSGVNIVDAVDGKIAVNTQ